MTRIPEREGSKQTSTSHISPLFPLVPTSKLAQVEDAAGMADEDARKAGYAGYASRVFTQVSLPYKDPLKADPMTTAWLRSNGGMTLMVEPHQRIVNGEIYREFPFGKYPRLILPWLTTKIVRADRAGERSPDGSMLIVLPVSTRGFFRDLGLQWSGSKAKDLTSQLGRLFGARFSVTEEGRAVTGNGYRTAQFQVAKAYQLWFGKDTGELAQGGLWDSEVVVSADFVTDLLATPIPIDLRALSVLAKSGPLAMDMYAWLNYRLPSARRSSVVPWELLNWQFGGQYARVRDFKAQFVKHLPAVQIVYPDAQMDARAEGLLIKPSPPAIPFDQINNRKPFGGGQ